MSQLPTGRMVFAVGQLPFEASNQETSKSNTFGTLVSVLDDQGRPANAEDFPRSWILPGSQTQLVVASANDPRIRAVITAIDRFGNESTPRLIASP